MRFSRRRSLLASCILLSAVSVILTQCSSEDTVVSTVDASSSGTDTGTADAGVFPLIIGHRGAPGYRPEHTIASYTLAIEMGADFIEPDCVMTSDHVLVVRHENEIGGTTDVATHPEFATRKKTKTVDGVVVKDGFFVEDFTLAEVKTLRARERLPDIRPANTAFDGQETIPTLQEVIDLAKSKGVGIYPETKHPTYFKSIGLPLEETLAQTLRDAGWHEASDPVFLQSFEPGSLQKLKTLTNLRRIQLIDETKQPYDFTVAGDPRQFSDLVKPEGLAFIAGYATGIGPSKNWIVPRDATGKLTAPTTLVADAHSLGLLVHSWTFRNENTFLPTDFRSGRPDSSVYMQERGDAPAEYRLFFGLGLDGLFSDCSDTAVSTRHQVYKH